ncbi:MAG TPA: methyl-accepting chemotaxis protein [Dictyobacter sp.]|jgi:methyl-accepting chemotaxis protein|nr:methyl-accepting chemotaxis protein [Dictyobacter sp.]
MFKFISNIQISRRLLLAFLLAAVVPGIVISILGFTFVRSQEGRSQAVQKNINAFKSATAANVYLIELKSSLETAYQKQYESNIPAVQNQTQNVLSQVHDNEGIFDQSVRSYQEDYQLATSPSMANVRAILLSDDPNSALPGQQQQLLNQIHETLWPAYRTAVDQAANAIDQKAPVSQVQSLLMVAGNDYKPLLAGWTQVTQTTEDINSQVAKVGPAQTNPILLGTVIAFLSTILIVTVIGYVVYVTIMVPLHDLATLTRRIAKGETSARAQIIGHDEIYLVANSMNNMLDNIVRLIQEAQYQRDRLQGQVEKLVSEVSGIGEGDLRVQAEVTADAFGVLADSFNYMIEELGSLIIRVKSVATEVESSIATILTRMTQLVESGNKQLGQISEAATEMEQMAVMNRQVADRAQMLYDVARVARQDAQVGRESLVQAVDGIGRISENVHLTAGKVQTLGERSREIDEIVEAISSISHQTNRLALDAAIQAAMAGDNGKGFGAVAADIRRLAERAKDQAAMITRIVRAVREDIGAVAISMQDTERETTTGARVTQEVGLALESVFAAVEHQAREIEHVNQVAMQQLQSSNTIVKIMQTVSSSTQKSSESTREASQNMQRLSNLAEQLRVSVEAFKLRENHNYAMIPNTSANFSLDEEPENPLTVSGVFRTVSAPLPPLTLPRQSTGVFAPVPREDGEQLSYTPMPTDPQIADTSGQDWQSFPSQDGMGEQDWQSLPQSEEWSANNQPNPHSRGW